MPISRRCLSILGYLMLFWAAFAVSADPLKDPKRIIDQRTVDLSPLFKWWAKHDGERPLKAWVRVTGSVTNVLGWGWVMQGRAERSMLDDENETLRPAGDFRFVLKNPPTEEMAQFAGLSAERKRLEAEQATLEASATNAAKRAKLLSDQDAANRRNHLPSRNLGFEATQWRHQENSFRQQLGPVEKQLAEIRKQMAEYPDPYRFTVDCFALVTSGKFNGMPVYDRGRVVK
jgi:hypothetical protein